MIRIKPMELSLVFMNFVLVAEVAHQIFLASETRSTNIARFVKADKEANALLADCFVPQSNYELQLRK
jgi:hypothetical protein